MDHRFALGLKEAAEAVGLSHWQLRKYIREGKLQAVRLGKRVLVEPSELARLVEEGRTATDQRKKGKGEHHDETK
jgi:excisionase family DNA binding protein